MENEVETIRVLLVLERLKRGGTETGTIELAKTLKNNGVYVGIAAEDGPLKYRTEQYGIPYFPLKKEIKHIQLKRIIIKEQFTHLHAYIWTTGTLYPCYLAAYNLIPIICTVTRTSLDLSKVTNWSNWVIFLSGYTSHEYPLKNQSFNVIPLSIDTNHYKLNDGSFISTESSLTITYAGRFDEKTKIALNIIDATKVLYEEGYNVKCQIVGDGEGSEEVDRRIAEVNHDADDNICCKKEWSNDMREVYAGSHIVVGSGQVAAEALSCGCNVIVSGIKGYLGRVVKDNIEYAIDTSFGDHHSIIGHSLSLLIRDLKDVISNPSSANTNRGLVDPKISFETIWRSILQCYKESRKQLQLINNQKP